MSFNPGKYPEKINLTNCDREPIHIIGQAQAHGVILACNKFTYEITRCSENSHQLLGRKADDLIGKHISTVIPQENLKDLEPDSQEKILLPHLNINGSSFFVIAHISGDHYILDMEPAGDNLNTSQFQEQLSKILNDLNSSPTLEEISARAVGLVKNLYGYDRVMLYRFDEEWNGEVVAEEKEDNLESWLGLHYPATDIPKPSRDLFLKQGIRIIQDVNYTPAPILPEISQLNNKPLDLSRSELRGVSPIHIEYLKNMKVGASLTAAIVLNGKLWGLFACHHYTPKFVNYHQRQSVKLLSQVFTNRLAVITAGIYKEKFGEAKNKLKLIIDNLRETGDVEKTLFSGNLALNDIVGSSGAAVSFNDKLYLIGKTPSEEEVGDLIHSFISQKENLFFTRNLEKLYPAASAYKDIASGLLSVTIGEGKINYILWFREEEVQTVDWGGNPQKSEEKKDGLLVLHPRKSFKKWSQSVSGIAKPWQEFELDAALAFRENLAYIILEQQQEKIKILNENLKAVNTELEAFSYSVSHDLRAPLRGIKGFAKILKEDFEGEMEEEAIKAVDIILRSASEMNSLIEDLLLYAKLGEEPVPQTPVNINDLISTILSSYNLKEDYPNTKIQIDGDLPDVIGNKRLLNQLFSNLISNALKYSGKKTNPVIHIGSKINTAGQRVYFVRDNGIGFDLKFQNKIFKVFTRLGGSEFPGTGIGLAIARKVVDKHKGDIWVESDPGKGSVFYFTFGTGKIVTNKN